MAEGPLYIVFTSPAAPRLDVPAWDAQGARFFGTRLERVDPTGGAVDGLQHGDASDGEPETRVRITPPEGPAGERRLAPRARSPRDLAAAEEAELRAGGGGLVLLARRCAGVWVVRMEADRDPLALRLAMVVASVALGPILDLRGPELFGVKTARGKLE